MSSSSVDVDSLRTTVESTGAAPSTASSGPDEAASPAWEELHRAREVGRRVKRDRERTAARGFDD